MTLGVETANAYVGRAVLDVRELFEVRGLDLARFGNLMMAEKSVNLPCEDPVTNAVNAAKPLVDSLCEEDRDSIEAVIVGTESGLDFGKPLSTYVHHYLGLGRRCRSFEVKHACYGGTAALRTALGLLAQSPRPGARALVVAADAGGSVTAMPYWEPSHGAGAVALLVGDRPDVLELDPGAAGLYSYEVMDTCRPSADLAAGDSDLSLLAYLECLDRSFADYRATVPGADIVDTFDHLVFHSPFGGMVKGAHRQLLRKAKRMAPAGIEADFGARVAGSLGYTARIGNTYAAGLFMALCSLVEHGDFTEPRRIGLFSYGSGCASEFYSGVVGPEAPARLADFKIGERLDNRHRLTMGDYDRLGRHGAHAGGAADSEVDVGPYQDVYEQALAGRGLLVLDRVVNYHRRYRWS
ncbi:3-hydroxy-3-methylglutaryl-ACP synthase [Streptomyces sp. NBC_01485]|uniref:hydroxymethylglutaryl-CoA synthase family protein n=1 Tax=Streptomyces sp. NBC_01485 TaxID=2903884 RepID=UPI002E31F8D4|nr:hydroxymethylglutaryl-CoA synthase [Streptomyces sp. NBC_01485]